MTTAHPAPWQVDRFHTQTGEEVFRLIDSLGQKIIELETLEQAETIVLSVNALGSDETHLEELARWKAAADAWRADEDRVRNTLSDEIARLSQTVNAQRDEIHQLKRNQKSRGNGLGAQSTRAH